MKIYLAKSQIQWISAIYVISQINFITGSNPKFIKNGFSVVKNVGILFLNMMTTHMVEQESQIDKESSVLNCKANDISRSLEFNRIELNNGFTNKSILIGKRL